MRRGELRRYTRPSAPDDHRVVVLLSSDGINDSSRPWLLGIDLRERDPGDILAIPVGRRWAYAGDLMRLYRAWIGERVDVLDRGRPCPGSKERSERHSTSEPGCLVPRGWSSHDRTVITHIIGSIRVS